MTASVETGYRHTLVTLVARVWRVHRNRRKVEQLANLTDAQLKDIGLTRGDVRRALALPLFADPSALLNEWSADRRLSSLPHETDRVFPAPVEICSDMREQPLAA